MDITHLQVVEKFCSKPTPIHGPVHKYGWDFSYLRIHFSRLPHTAAKGLIDPFYQEVRYASMVIDTIINIFSRNEVKSHLHICDHSIVTIGIRGFCFGL